MPISVLLSYGNFKYTSGESNWRWMKLLIAILTRLKNDDFGFARALSLLTKNDIDDVDMHVGNKPRSIINLIASSGRIYI